MTKGVYINVTGYGLRIKPKWPFAFIHPADVGGDGTALGVIRCGEDGQPHVTAGPDRPTWRIETQLYSVTWPSGFTLECAGENDPFAPFLLWGPDKSLIWVQGPIRRTRLTAPSDLVGPGQQVVDQQANSIELAYTEEGAPWRQSHHILDLDQDRLAIVTSQAPTPHATQTLKSGNQLAHSFRTNE
ncbi:hypothetical protein SAMN04489713_10457 [Actinomadura madurae]|uniref:Uncharacterized protein n=1 Tax=Actinomadura madurae TaxID=1993 RepID=A0A1I5EBY3_9ACTN|nr:hypothetical protein [Actinomadura madurae]SFO08890.1 hypothetical protein SAMN04489713_10457 [Actinomadura madurae]